MSPSPTISVFSSTHPSEEPIHLDAPPAEATTYPVHFYAPNTLQLGPHTTVDDFLADPTTIASFLYTPDGSLYLESYSETHNLFLTPTFTRANRTLVRRSEPGVKHFYAIITQDVTVEVDGIPAKIVLKYDSNEHVQVQHSYIPEPTRKTPEREMPQGVCETPAVERRHIDPNSSRRPPVEVTKSGLMTGGVPAGTQEEEGGDETESDSDGEGEKVVRELRFESTELPMELEELEGVMSSGNNRSGNPGEATAPMEDIEEEKAPGVVNNPESTKEDEDLQDEKDEKSQHHIHLASKSLPEAFGYEKNKKLHTPAKTYGKQSHFSAKKKRKSDGSDATRRASTISVPEAEEGDDIEEEELPTLKKRTPGKARKAIPDDEDITSTLDANVDNAPFSTAPEDSPAVTASFVPTAPMPTRKTPTPAPTATKAQSRSKSTAKTIPASTEKPKPTPTSMKRKKPSPEVVISSRANDTQYTFPGTDEDSVEEDLVPAPKRSKPSPKAKTPKTVKTKIPRTASAKKASTASIKSASPPKAKSNSPDFRTTGHYEGSPPRIAFTNSALSDDKSTKSFLRSSNAKALPTPADSACNFLITGAPELKRTPKLIVAVARGIPILTESWITESRAAGYWLDPDAYTFTDPTTEKRWGFKLADAVKRGKQGENNVLKGKTVHLTASLALQCKAGGLLDSLIEMCEAAGAKDVLKKTPRGSAEEDAVVLGKEDGEKDLAALKKGGWKVRSTAVVGMSVFRGSLQEGDEFLVGGQ